MMSSTRRIVIDAEGVARQFLFFLPAPAPTRIPLVIMFHGTGGTAAWAEEETGWSNLAARKGFAVAYPEGLPPDPTKPPKFLTNPPVWHDGSFPDFGVQLRDREFVGTMLDVIAAEAPIDPTRIYATGFSNGAGMTFACATFLADRIAAIAPVAGHCWIENPRPVRPVPTFAIYGKDDPIIPTLGGQISTPWGQTYKPSVVETLRKWAHAIGCGQTPEVIQETAQTVLEAYPAGADAERFLALTVNGLGHHWPGGLGRLSERIAGKPSAAVNACERIWEFFRGKVLA